MKAVVVGAGGALGEALAAQLCADGHQVIATMRRPNAAAAARLSAFGVEIRAFDLEAIDASVFAGAELAVFAPILTLSIAALPALREAGVGRTVFFSSNNVAADSDAPIYRALAAAEACVLAEAPSPVIVRPTLLYGDPRLATVTRLMRLALRSPVLPMPGSGAALTQPLFVADAARVALASSSGVVSVGGPEVVTMRAFYRAIVDAAGSRALPVGAPRALLRLGADVMGGRFPLSADQIARAGRDRVAPMHPLAQTRLADGLAALAAALT